MTAEAAWLVETVVTCLPHPLVKNCCSSQQKAQEVKPYYQATLCSKQRKSKAFLVHDVGRLRQSLLVVRDKMMLRLKCRLLWLDLHLHFLILSCFIPIVIS